MKLKKTITLICKFFLLGGVISFFVYFSYFTTHPSLPSEKQPLLFYSNQTSDDLKIVFQQAIRRAKSSLFIQIYGCTDQDLLQELKKAFEKKVLIELFYDPSGSGALKKKLPFATPLPCSGLMHKKIVIVDEETVFLGSANLTPTSLRMHDNIVVALHQKELAHFITHSTSNQIQCQAGNQTIELWQLPDFQNQCLKRVLSAIKQAKNSIYLALFTFTHPQILEEIIEAKNRGVSIQIAIDYYSAKGASKKAIETLRSAHIEPYINQPGKLLHHKWGLIDQKTLLLGSANWTKAAFSKNEDCLLIVHDLSETQRNYFLKIWRKIELNSLQ